MIGKGEFSDCTGNSSVLEADCFHLSGPEAIAEGPMAKLENTKVLATLWLCSEIIRSNKIPTGHLALLQCKKIEKHSSCKVHAE